MSKISKKNCAFGTTPLSLYVSTPVQPLLIEKWMFVGARAESGVGPKRL